MALEILVPRLGWTMEEGTFGGWLKQDGETVSEGDALFTLESDKGAQDVESVEGGILRIPEDAPQAGATVKVGEILGYLAKPGEQVPAAIGSAGSSPGESTAAREAPLPESVESESAEIGGGEQATKAEPRAAGAGPTISPRALRLANDLGVDWSKVSGSGRNGRIVERDIRRVAEGPDVSGG
jgi:pyruvate dehydrogenase E2 component (dihydrolipoamide acetyltransferase)